MIINKLTKNNIGYESPKKVSYLKFVNKNKITLERFLLNIVG